VIEAGMVKPEPPLWRLRLDPKKFRLDAKIEAHHRKTHHVGIFGKMRYTVA
jgi:hypothetical protein